MWYSIPRLTVNRDGANQAKRLADLSQERIGQGTFHSGTTVVPTNQALPG